MASKIFTAAFLGALWVLPALADGCEGLPGPERNGVFYSPDGRASRAVELKFRYADPNNHFLLESKGAVRYRAGGRFFIRSGVNGRTFLNFSTGGLPSDVIVATGYTRALAQVPAEFVSIYRREIRPDICVGQSSAQGGTSAQGEFVGEGDYVVFHLADNERTQNHKGLLNYHFKFRGYGGTCLKTRTPRGADADTGRFASRQAFGLLERSAKGNSVASRAVADAPVQLAQILLPNKAMAQRSGGATKAPVAGLSSSLHLVEQDKPSCIEFPAPLPTGKLAGFFGYSGSAKQQARRAFEWARSGKFKPEVSEYWFARIEGRSVQSQISIRWK